MGQQQLNDRQLAWEKTPARLPPALLLLLMFAALSCAATVTVMLLSTTAPPVPRYLIAALSWLLVSGVFVLVFLLGKRFRYAGLGLALVLTGLLARVGWRVRDVRNTAPYFYPEQLACIDRALASSGARHGIAQYWDDKRIQALSCLPLTLAQYTGKLDHMQWILPALLRPALRFCHRCRRRQSRIPSATGAINRSEWRAAAVNFGNRTVLLFGSAGLRTGPAISNVR